MPDIVNVLPPVIRPIIFCKRNWGDNWTRNDEMRAITITRATLHGGQDSAIVERPFGMLAHPQDNFNLSYHAPITNIDDGWIMIKVANEVLFMGYVDSIDRMDDAGCSTGAQGVQQFNCLGLSEFLSQIAVWRHKYAVPVYNRSEEQVPNRSMELIDTVSETVDYCPGFGVEETFASRPPTKNGSKQSNGIFTIDDKSVISWVGSLTVDNLFRYLENILEDEYSGPSITFSNTEEVSGVCPCWEIPVVSNVKEILINMILPISGLDIVFEYSEDGMNMRIVNIDDEENSFSLTTNDIRLSRCKTHRKTCMNFGKIRLVGQRIIVQDLLVGKMVLDERPSCEHSSILFDKLDSHCFGISLANYNKPELNTMSVRYDPERERYDITTALHTRRLATLNVCYDDDGSEVPGPIVLIDGQEYERRKNKSVGQSREFFDSLVKAQSVQLGYEPLDFTIGVRLNQTPDDRIFAGYAKNNVGWSHRLTTLCDWEYWDNDTHTDIYHAPPSTVPADNSIDLCIDTMMAKVCWLSDYRIQKLYTINENNDRELVIYEPQFKAVYDRSQHTELYNNGNIFGEVVRKIVDRRTLVNQSATVIYNDAIDVRSAIGASLSGITSGQYDNPATGMVCTSITWSFDKSLPNTIIQAGYENNNV